MTNNLPRSQSPSFAVPWWGLSAGLAVLAAGSLGALVVISMKTNADALSTTALALAILAFSAQLVISLAQAAANGQQLAHVERVNASTQTALATLQTASSALIDNQGKHFSDLLRAAVGRDYTTAPTDSEAAESDDLVNTEVPPAPEPERPSRAKHTELSRLLSSYASMPRVPHETPPRSAENRVLLGYPDETRGRLLAQQISDLTGWESAMFSNLATRIFHTQTRTEDSGIWLSEAKDLSDIVSPLKKLLESGLIRIEERIYKDGEERLKMSLTPMGAEAASMFVGLRQKPEWLVSYLKEK